MVQAARVQHPTRFLEPDVGVGSRLLGGAVGFAVAKASMAGLTPTGPMRDRLERVNHRGEPITLAQGPAVVLGTLAGVATTPGLPRNVRRSGLLAVAASGAVGAYDDLYGSTDTKGLAGHLKSLARGEVTSGAVKVLAIGATGVVAGAWSRGGRGGPVDAVLAGVVVAGSANLLNLFDLRPGRATKVFLAAALPAAVSRGTSGDLLSAPIGASCALLDDDLHERSMLGDTGANAVGAVLGTAVAATLSRRPLLLAAAAVVALTLASERISFSEVIQRNSVLRAIDELGRRPAS